ncbi:putative Calcium/calmodulin-dependent protein kinase kinase 1 [Monocercomonoides exilis]|uniref:putative Calcium/calmodulin-dependent protein kinase kinase 1 n=1 Tax=Monocercomonoides exilis TaxID=2049356 RepID=UPI003559AB75|nr:putative Calcium/calmodulin-dependent protein kinase kinase 1 [Monocercomonoides exilis]|eukprot:MONOS_11064.1-p1 / transcript=MONOS_11064.1 / gene=MONOS_11064 / organism=Monocercomonoides_exilis_PA203 / gene_product=calcium / transcript_product=calcium / location=Mono_scaffold00534:6842-9946(-) / protein_length=664 / sequence_SO=supercontig / SO=protein_coding / is_pseudo=false
MLCDKNESAHGTEADLGVVDTSRAKTHVSRRTGNEFVNQYEMRRKLGEGSFGTVWLCLDHQSEPQKKVAMKILQKQRLANKKKGNDAMHSALANVKREIAIMKKLDHPNVVRLIEVIDDPNSDNLYIVMEYLPGGPCMRKGDASLQEDICRLYMRDIVMGLEYCHDNDIIHHDIKPDNILVGEKGNLKLCDFGVSMLSTGKEALSHSIRGTPPFLAPEVVTQSPTAPPYAGRPVDVWAVGITLFLFIFGRFPFKEKTLPETFNAIAHKKLILPSSVSRSLSDLLFRLLDKNPTTRITIPQMKEHPWLTLNGTMPFPAKSKVVQVSSEEVERAITLLTPFTLVVGLKIKMGSITRRMREKNSLRSFGDTHYSSNQSNSQSLASLEALKVEDVDVDGITDREEDEEEDSEDGLIHSSHETNKQMRVYPFPVSCGTSATPTPLASASPSRISSLTNVSEPRSLSSEEAAEMMPFAARSLSHASSSRRSPSTTSRTSPASTPPSSSCTSLPPPPQSPYSSRGLIPVLAPLPAGTPRKMFDGDHSNTSSLAESASSTSRNSRDTEGKHDSRKERKGLISANEKKHDEVEADAVQTGSLLMTIPSESFTLTYPSFQPLTPSSYGNNALPYLGFSGHEAEAKKKEQTEKERKEAMEKARKILNDEGCCVIA